MKLVLRLSSWISTRVVGKIEPRLPKLRNKLDVDGDSIFKPYICRANCSKAASLFTFIMLMFDIGLP